MRLLSVAVLVPKILRYAVLMVVLVDEVLPVAWSRGVCEE